MSDKELNALFCKCAEYEEQGLRCGQALSNALFKIRNDLYQRIDGTAIDPFYSDENVDNCLIFLMEENEICFIQ